MHIPFAYTETLDGVSNETVSSPDVSRVVNAQNSTCRSRRFLLTLPNFVESR